MKHKLSQSSLLVLAILILLTPAAWAQEPTGGSRLVIGRAFVLPEGQELDGNLVVLGGSATLEEGSVVRGDVAVFGGSATVAGTVQGNVVVLGGSTTLEDSAVVEGDFATIGGSVSRSPSAVVSGEVFGEGIPLPFLNRFDRSLSPGRPWPPLPATRETQRTGVWGVLGSLVAWQFRTLGTALFLALLGVVLVALAPRAMGRIASAAAGGAFVSFGMGLLTLVVGILLGLLLMIACCLGLFVWLVLAVAWLVGWVAVGLWLGQRLLQALNARNASSIGEVAIGVFLITVLTQLPACIGFFVGLVIGCMGLGAVVLTRFGTRSFDDSQAPGRALQDNIESAPTLLEPPSTAAEPAVIDDVVEAADTPLPDEETPGS
jgi:hypothetical protein